MKVPTKKSVCILYGWAEGQWHGKKLRQQLHHLGYSVTRQPAAADIIIAHSGGIFLLPRQHRARLVILIGLPNWPNRHPLKNLPRKIAQEIAHLKDPWHFIIKTLYNGLYIGTKARHNTKVWLGWRNATYPQSSESCAIITLRNQYDSFMHADKSVDLAKEYGWTCLSIKGASHDDVWVDPKPYIDLIQKFG